MPRKRYKPEEIVAKLRQADNLGPRAYKVLPASSTHLFVRFWTIADKRGFWPGTVCPLMTQSGHAASARIWC
jgi:hypothetical protein